MSISIVQSNVAVNKLSATLASLQPKLRTKNQAKFAEHYDDIVNAIKRGVPFNAIRAALVENGISVSSVTFKKLMENTRKLREATKSEPDTAAGDRA